MPDILKVPIVDKSKCQGYSVCAGIAPDVFELDEKGKSCVRNPKGTNEQTIQDAIDGCPVHAISWEEE